MKKVIFLLGVDDPEMRTIEEIVREAAPFAHAEFATADGRRVHPGNAYKADLVPDLESGDTLVRVECEPTSVPEGVEVIVIDHHRSGDPGYSLGPDRFWEASSLGRIVALINRDELAVSPLHHDVCAMFSGY